MNKQLISMIGASALVASTQVNAHNHGNKTIETRWADVQGMRNGKATGYREFGGPFPYFGGRSAAMLSTPTACQNSSIVGRVGNPLVAKAEHTSAGLCMISIRTLNQGSEYTSMLDTI